jgi:hypothetical protein
MVPLRLSLRGFIASLLILIGADLLKFEPIQCFESLGIVVEAGNSTVAGKYFGG